MGAIHEAENLWTGRRVALKAMHAWAARDADHGRRFLREARTAGALNHPNIVVVHDLLRDPAEGLLYMVLEHLVGEDLFERLRLGRAFTPRDALEVMLPVMHALAAAHATGVIHRDVKPENIFLAQTQGGITPKLLDFGVARFLHHRAVRITDPGRILGTVGYMSPEHHAGREDLDGRTDVWSVGVVLYELLAGLNPFDRDSAVETYAAIMHGAPVDLRQHGADLSDVLVALVNRALERDREARHPSMRDLLDEALRCPELTHDRDSAHTPACRALRLTAREPTSERTLVWESGVSPRVVETALALRDAPPANDVVVLPQASPANDVPAPAALARWLLLGCGALAMLLAAALLVAPITAPPPRAPMPPAIPTVACAPAPSPPTPTPTKPALAPVAPAAARRPPAVVRPPTSVRAWRLARGANGRLRLVPVRAP
jgi:serine/threonine-protein kinase